MSFSSYYSKQARKPTGIFGRFIMPRIFNRGNAALNALVYEALSVQKNDHVLEIGFGPGTLIKKIAEHLEDGLVEGIDFSEPMVVLAQKKNKRHIVTGKAKIHLGDFDEVPFDDHCFDKIFSVNTVYFWKVPKATISKIGRALKPGGRLVIGFHDKPDMEKMPLHEDVFRYYSTEDLSDLLSVHGSLHDIEIVSRKGRPMMCYCAIGTK